MATLVAEPLSGVTKWGQWPLSVKRCVDGWHGEKCFMVNTDDPLAAHDAQNLPRYGTPWVPGRNFFRCYDIHAVFKAGTNDPNEEAGGWCFVTCLFREPGDGRPLPYPGSAYAEIGTRVTNIRQMYDINRNPNIGPGQQGDLDLQIENGKGVTKEYAFETRTVRIFPNNQSAPAILQRQRRLADLVTRQVVASDVLHFPNIMGLGQEDTAEARTARLHLQSHGIEAGYHYFDLEFLIGTSPAFWMWFAVDSSGSALRQISSQQYTIESMADVLVV